MEPREMSTILLLGLVLSVSVFFAQNPTKGTIEGEVVVSSTAQPVAGARVRIQSGDDEPQFTTTDQSGRFRFDALEITSYQISVRFPGLIASNASAASVSSSESARLTADSPTGRVRFQMKRYSAISGKVIDASGAPVEGAGVEVMLRHPLGGFHTQSGSRYEEDGFQYLGQRRADTNDVGEYRIAPLPSGTYYVVVRPSPGLADSADRGTFYPHALRASEAKPVELGEGENRRGIDLQMIRQEGVTLKGRIHPLTTQESTPKGVPRTYTSLLAWTDSQVGGGPPSRSSIRGDYFEIHGLLPGRYVLEAATREFEDSYLRNPLAAARLVVDIGTENVDGIELIMARVPDLEGQVVFQPGCPTIPLLINAQGDSHQAMSLGSVRPEPDGRFVIKRLLPGKYSISLRPEANIQAFRPSSMKLGNAEISKSSFEATADTEGPLVITIGCVSARR